MNKLNNILNNFFLLEVEKDLFSKKFNDIYIWELIRFIVVNKIIRELGCHKNSLKKTNKLLFGLKKLIYLIRIFFSHNPFFAKKGCIFIFGHARRQQLDGINTDIYTDFLKEELNKNDIDYQDFETFSEDRKVINNRNSKDILFFDVIQLFRVLYKKKITFTAEELKVITDIEGFIKTEFDVKIDVKKIVVNNLQGYMFYEKFFKYFFNKKKPKLVFQVVGYELINKTMNSVSKELNIPTIEIQHGVIDKYHLGYSVGKIGAETVLHYSPDYIFTWGSYWSKAGNFAQNVVGVDIGYPFFEFNKSKFLQDNSSDDKNILVVSQWSIGQELSSFIIELASGLPEYIFYYKLHPGEFHKLENDYARLKDIKNIVVIKGEKNIYELFSITSIQIGVYSTGLYEGLGFGLSTILVNLPGVEYLENVIENKIVKVVDNVEQCNKIIKDGYGENTNFDKNDFFNDKPLTNFISAIKKII